MAARGRLRFEIRHRLLACYLRPARNLTVAARLPRGEITACPSTLEIRHGNRAKRNLNILHGKWSGRRDSNAISGEEFTPLLTILSAHLFDSLDQPEQHVTNRQSGSTR